MDLEDVLIDSALQLSALSRQAAELGHHGLVGRTREEFFRNGWGRHLIPARYGIGSGRVLGVNGMMSSEADVIFYDALDCPKFLPSESTIFPSSGVHGIAEIKSTLDKRELEDAVTKIETFKRLYDDDPQIAPFGSRHVMRASLDPRPFGIVFAFDAATSLATLMANLLEAEEQMQPAHRCNLIVINNVGLIARSMDGQTPLAVWAHTGTVLPRQTIVLPEERKTLGSFYWMLSAMLVSVPTFPVNPALYGRVARDVDGHIVAGQIRQIDAQTLAKTTLKTSFLRHIVEAVETEAPTSVLELERRAFSQTALPYTPFGDGPVWLYDPDGNFDFLDFPPRRIAGVGEVRSLASSCLLLSVDNRTVVVPRTYLNNETSETTERN